MTPSPTPPPDRRLEESIERRRERAPGGSARASARSRMNLAMIGALGWLIVVPTLAGIFAGQWVDRRAGGGLTFTGAFLVAGLALGAWLAWQRMHRP